MTVVSISGIRGVFNQDLRTEELVEYVTKFVPLAGHGRVLVGRDTRASGPVISRAVESAAMAAGADVVDYGVISTPALFRESRNGGLSAVMVTASHNEPEWNGLKFIVGGRGINQEELDVLTRRAKGREGTAPPRAGVEGRAEGSSYNSELVKLAGGEEAGAGVKVVLDLNGGAAIGHAPEVMRGIGCEVSTIGDTPGLFARTIDPTNDPLEMLCKTVKRTHAHVGFAFDCDGDRLVLVDNEGRKRTGDYMLTLGIKEALRDVEEKNVVVSTDTTQAIDDVVVEEEGGKVFRAKVGEANVIAEMLQRRVRLGGEGSSGGMIDADFNHCRDSMIAATRIVAALGKKGPKIFDQVKSYSLARVKLEIPRSRALAAVRKLQRDNPDADVLDGLKVRPSRSSWVLIRVSGTEDVVRVSAEAPNAKQAEQLAHSYLERVKRAGA